MIHRNFPHSLLLSHTHSHSLALTLRTQLKLVHSIFNQKPVSPPTQTNPNPTQRHYKLTHTKQTTSPHSANTGIKPWQRSNQLQGTRWKFPKEEEEEGRDDQRKPTHGVPPSLPSSLPCLLAWLWGAVSRQWDASRRGLALPRLALPCPARGAPSTQQWMRYGTTRRDARVRSTHTHTHTHSLSLSLSLQLKITGRVEEEEEARSLQREQPAADTAINADTQGHLLASKLARATSAPRRRRRRGREAGQYQ